jgi:hypothetical protein
MIDKRVLRRYRRKVDALVKKVRVFDKETERELLIYLKDFRDRLLGQISGAEGWSADYLGKLKGEVEILIARFDGDLAVFADGKIDLAWMNGASFATETLEAAGITLSPLGLSEEQLLMAKGLSADLIKGLSQDALKKVNAALSLGMVAEKSPFEVAKEIDKILGWRQKRGITWDAERIVRTETARAFELGKKAQTDRFADEGIEMMKYWLTSQDTRVRPSHRAAGLKYSEKNAIPYNEPYIVGGYKCQHPHDPALPAKESIGCRCLSVPIPVEFSEKEYERSKQFVSVKVE